MERYEMVVVPIIGLGLGLYVGWKLCSFTRPTHIVVDGLEKQLITLGNIMQTIQSDPVVTNLRNLDLEKYKNDTLMALSIVFIKTEKKFDDQQQKVKDDPNFGFKILTLEIEQMARSLEGTGNCILHVVHAGVRVSKLLGVKKVDVVIGKDPKGEDHYALLLKTDRSEVLMDPSLKRMIDRKLTEPVVFRSKLSWFSDNKILEDVDFGRWCMTETFHFDEEKLYRLFVESLQLDIKLKLSFRVGSHSFECTWNHLLHVCCEKDKKIEKKLETKSDVRKYTETTKITQWEKIKEITFRVWNVGYLLGKNRINDFE